jgi:tetratricopeptide (TPR) repeat protein
MSDALDSIVPGATRTRTVDAKPSVVPMAQGRTRSHPDELLSLNASKTRWPWVLLTMLATLAALWWMVPRSQDLASLHGSAPPKLSDLEAAVESGDRSNATMIALAREALRLGDVIRATRLLSDLLRRHPNEVAALQLLVQAHDAAGRPREAVAAAESLMRAAPTEDHLRDVVARFSTLGDERQTLRALTTLVSTMPGAKASEYRRLAGLQISGGAPRAALATMDALVKYQPQAADAELAALRMQALLAIPAVEARGAAPSPASLQAASDAAVGVVSQWLKSQPIDKADTDVMLLVKPLSRAGQHERIIALLDPWLASQQPNVLAAWTQAMRATQRGEQAAKRLAALPNVKASSALLAERVDLSLELGRLRPAALALRSHGWSKADGAVLARFAEAVFDARGNAQGSAARLAADPGNKPLGKLTTFENDLGDAEREGWLRELWLGGQAALSRSHAITAARVAVAVGDHGAAQRLADASLQTCNGRADCAVRLAAIHHVHGRDGEAVAALKSAHEGGVIDEALLLDYARTAMVHGQARQALDKVNNQRRAPASTSYNEAWALLATHQGQHQDVERWLDATPDLPIQDSVLREVFKLAIDGKAHSLSVNVGQRLGNKLKVADRVMVAQSLMELGRVPEAMIAWKNVRASTRAYEDAYARALEQVAKRNAAAVVTATASASPTGALPATQNPLQSTSASASTAAMASQAPSRPLGTSETELASLLVERLKTAQTPQARGEWVQQLVQLQAFEQALPWLEPLALADPVRWLGAMELATQQTRQPAKMLPVLRKAVMMDAFTRAQRLAMAQQLVSAGDVEHGDFVQRMMLSDKPIDDPDVQRLFARWGQRLTPDQLDWLEAQARNVNAEGERGAATRAAWMRKLNATGGAARTVAMVRRASPWPKDGPEFDAFVEALNKTGDRDTLSQILKTSSRAP